MFTVRVGSTIAEVERRLILATLREYQEDKPKSASVLGISLKTLYNRLNHYQAPDVGGQASRGAAQSRANESWEVVSVEAGASDPVRAVARAARR